MPFSLGGGDEELRIVAVRTAVGHGESSGAAVRESEVLVPKGFAVDALPAGTVPPGDVALHCTPGEQGQRNQPPQCARTPCIMNLGMILRAARRNQHGCHTDCEEPATPINSNSQRRTTASAASWA